jgi:hypothetical protein
MMVIIVSHHYDHLSINDLNDAGISLISMYYIQAYLQQMFSDSLPVLYSANSLYTHQTIHVHTEAEFLFEIHTKVLEFSSLLFTVSPLHLCLEICSSSNLRKLFQFPQFVTVHCKWESRKTPLPYDKRNPYRNLKPENSQDYAQKPQRNCTFMNSASVHGSHSFVSCMYLFAHCQYFTSPPPPSSTTHRNYKFVIIPFLVVPLNFLTPSRCVPISA